MLSKAPPKRLPFAQSIKLMVSNFLNDLRTSLLWVMPCVILLSLVVIILGLGQYFFQTNSDALNAVEQLYKISHTVFGYLLTTAFTFTIAMRLKEPRPPFVMLSLFYFSSFHFLVQYFPASNALQYLVALLTPLYTVQLLAWLRTKPILSLRRLTKPNNQFSDAMSLIIPAFLVMGVVLVVNVILLSAWSSFTPPAITLADTQESPYLYGSLFTVISSLSHFLGIHSIYTLGPLLHDPLYDALIHNTQQYKNLLDNYHVLTWTSAPVFGLLGGSGSTMGLVIAMLICCKEKSLRTIAYIAIPLSLLNINEILIFGIPILLNPTLFMPFLLAPMINICLAVLCMNIGLIAPTVIHVPFISPIFANAYIATGGDINAVILQLVCLIISTLIYMPFIRHLDKKLIGQKIYFPKFDSYYSRKQEEAQVLNDDVISRITAKQREDKQLEKSLSFISEIEFFLEYQPQICPISQQVKGAEALIRASDNQKTFLPYTFLPWLEKAHMMQDIDIWVINQAVEDIKVLQQHNIDIRLSLNMSAQTLLDNAAINTIINTLEESGLSHHFDIEVTEQELLQDHAAISTTFQKLHNLGIHIHIDDFGTGYSSLSYLSLFDVDVMKIDRSFVLGTKTHKGKQLFKSLFDIAESQQIGVIVEGVETEAELSLIPAKNNILIQGWLFSKALPLDNFMLYYQQHNTIPQKGFIAS